MVLHDIAWYCIVLHGVAWYCMVLHGIARYCILLHRISWEICKKFHSRVEFAIDLALNDLTIIHLWYLFWKCIVDPPSRPPSINNKILTLQEIGTSDSIFSNVSMKFSTMNRKWRDRNSLAGIHFSRPLAPSWEKKLTLLQKWRLSSLHSIHQPHKTAVVHWLIAKLDYHRIISFS